MLFENLNYLLRERGAMTLSEEDFLALQPSDLWDYVSQLAVSFEVLNTVDLKERARLHRSLDIKLVVLDVDGVFTDGGMYYSSSGEEQKKFNVKDGMGIVRAIADKLQFGIISASSRDEVIRQRAKTLGIQHIYVGNQPKLEVLECWLYTLNLSFENVAYIGDDVNDVDLLKKVGLGACPADAVSETRAAADIVLKRKGGQGCIREFLDFYISPLKLQS